MAYIKEEIKSLLDGGLTPGEAVLPYTRPVMRNKNAGLVREEAAPSVARLIGKTTFSYVFKQFKS